FISIHSLISFLPIDVDALAIYVPVMETTDPKKARVEKIIATLKKTHPDAKLALDFTNPLELLIALILAAQARDERVNVVTAELFKKYKTAADWANEKPEVLQEAIHNITFFRNKSK